MGTMGERRRFYFSLRSPYSWLAYLDLTAGHARLAQRLEWVPFWEPDEATLRLLHEAGGDFNYAQMSQSKHLYVLQDMRRQAQARGLSFSWPVDRSPRWEVPHAAYLVAARAGYGPRFLRVAHRARWQEGRDICAPATVADLAAELGLPPDELAGAADRDDVRQEGVAALLTAHRDGVFGVPFFVNGFAKFWGGGAAGRVRRVLPGEAASQPTAQPQEPALEEMVAAGARPFDDGHAGGWG